VVVWDNACVLHAGDHSAVVGDRVFHRGMVDADGHVRDAA
jgi:taurine dioxygenase